MKKSLNYPFLDAFESNWPSSPAKKKTKFSTRRTANESAYGGSEAATFLSGTILILIVLYSDRHNFTHVLPSYSTVQIFSGSSFATCLPSNGTASALRNLAGRVRENWSSGKERRRQHKEVRQFYLSVVRSRLEYINVDHYEAICYQAQLQLHIL